jgi:hypothetical protein
MPEQSWLPLGQAPEHDAPAAIQAPAHNFVPEGQVPPHAVPSQVAVPPVGTVQGTQAMPQLATSSFFTHTPTQLCIPDGQIPPASPASPPPRPRSLPASVGRSTAASTTVPPEPPVLVAMSRERAVVQPPATIMKKATASREPALKRFIVECIPHQIER